MVEAASLNPEDMVEGGGLVDDVDATITEASFDMFDYNGKVVPGVPSLKAILSVEGDEVTQFWSMGNAKDWIPSDDGSQLISVGTANGIRLSSNGGIFLKSLIDAGFPADKLGDDITVLGGLEGHFIRVPAPKRNIPGKEKSKFEETILTISEISKLPWEKTKPKAAPKGKAKATKAKGKAKPKAAPEEDAGDIGEKTTGAVMEILSVEGTVEKKALPGIIFKIRKDDEDRNAMVKMVFDEEFLSAGPWEYDDGVLVMG